MAEDQDKDLQEEKKQDEDLQNEDPGQKEGLGQQKQGKKESAQERIDKIYGKFKHSERETAEVKQLLEDAQKDNKALAGTVDKLFKQLEEDKKEIKDDIKEAVWVPEENTLEKLQAELDEAVANDETAKAIKIQGQIFNEQLKVMRTESKKDIEDTGKKTAEDSKKSIADTVFNEWLKDNDWYNSNEKAKKYADYLSNIFDPEKKLDTRSFFDGIGKEVETVFPDIKKKEEKKPGAPAVEGVNYGKRNSGDSDDLKLTEEELEVCRKYGTDPKAYAKEKNRSENK
jgi:hypothetical protein